MCNQCQNYHKYWLIFFRVPYFRDAFDFKIMESQEQIRREGIRPFTCRQVNESIFRTTAFQGDLASRLN